ncbi:MAG: hypothetical protein EGQ83_08505 [Holdemanella biformis]|nr:hypothetical protein [Holdemanella biformis]
MKKVIGLMFVLLCFTGCANKEINYEKPSSIKEENYATYADWVEDEMLMIDHYLEISDKELADIKKDAMKDPEYLREFVESFNEQIEGLLQEGK